MENRPSFKLMPFLRRLTLKRKLIWIYMLAIFIPITILGYLYLSKTRNVVYQTAADAMLNDAREVSQELNTALRSYEMLASLMTGDKQLISSLEARYDHLIDAYDAYLMLWKQYQNYIQNWPGLRHVTIYVNNGTMASAPPYLIRTDQYLQAMEEYQLILASKASGYWSGVREPGKNAEYWSPNSAPAAARTFAYSRLLSYSENRYASKNIVTIEVYESILLDILSGLSADTSGALYSGMGDMITFTGDQPETEQLDDLRRRLARQGPGSLVHWETEDSLWCAVILNNGWRLVTHGLLRDIMQPVRALTMTALIFLLFSSLLSFAMIYLFSNSLSRRTNALVQKMRRANSNLEAAIDPPLPGYDEIAVLDRQFTRTAENLQATIRERYVLKLEKARYQLDALLTQISPHFLYNALSTVNWLIDSGDMEKAHLAVESLSKFYQVNLSRGKDMISLEDEQACLEAYLDIQRLRYPGRIRLFNTIDPIYNRVSIPKLTLQTLVDNCIHHGMAGEREMISILLSAKESGDRVVLSVQDDGLGISPERLAAIQAEQELPSHGNGTGIRHINQRLKLYFGEGYGVRLSSGKDGGTLAEIELPLSTPETEPHDTEASL